METSQQTPQPESESSAAQIDLAVVCAALVEMLVLVGGMLWLMSGPSWPPPVVRITLIATVAALGGAWFAVLLARRTRAAEPPRPD